MRRHGYFHLTDGESEAQNSYLTCQGHRLKAAEANLGCMITWSWVASGVMFGFMKARSGNFTGLFLPPCLPFLSVCLSLSKHIASRTAVTQETLVPISNTGQVYFWGIVCLSQGAMVANGDRLESAPITPAHLFPGAPWRGSRTGPLARVLTSPLPCPPGCDGTRRTAPLPFPDVPTLTSWVELQD